MLWLKTSFQLLAIGALCMIAAQTSAEPAGLAPRDDTPFGSPARFAEVNRLLAAQEGRVSCVVLDSGGRVLFRYAAEERYELASVAKIYILVSYLDQLAREQRDPTGEEFEDLRAMITHSDNVPATDFFHALGGVEGINAFLQSKGMAAIEPAEDSSWGSMRASPSQVAEFLVGLHRQRLLPSSSTYLALSFLGGVVDEQAWGVGTASDTGAGGTVYFKNGWFPSDEGWIVHSAGIVTERREQITFVFMTDQQPSFEQPVQTIEAAVKLLRDALNSSRRTFTPPMGVDIVPLPTPTRPDTERP